METAMCMHPFDVSSSRRPPRHLDEAAGLVRQGIGQKEWLFAVV